MTQGSINVSGSRKVPIVLNEETISAGETTYLIGHATSGPTFDTAFKVAGVYMAAQNQSTGGGSTTVEVWKDTTASGAAIYSANLGTGTGALEISDFVPTSEAASSFSTAEKLIVRVVSVTNVVDGLSVVVYLEFAE
jgi:hypothetical protein